MTRFFKIMITAIFAVTLIGAVALFTVLYLNNSKAAADSEPNIDEVLEASVDTEEITTNLLSDDYVRIKFKIQTDSKDTKEELQKRDFQLKNVLIQELAAMKSEDFKGKEGITELEETLKKKMNDVLQEGSIVRVYTTSFILQ